MYIIIRSVNEHKHRVGGKDMYTFSSFLRLSVGNTLRLSPIVWSTKKIRGAYKSFKRISILFLFVLTFDQESFFPFCFGDEKNEKKKQTLIAGFFVFMLLFLLLLFFFVNIIERDFFPCSPDVNSNPPSIKKNFAEVRHEKLQPKSICSKINSRCLGR